MFVASCFWVVVIKNGCSVLDHGNKKPDIYLSIYLSIYLVDFLHPDTNLGKLNVNLIITG